MNRPHANVTDRRRLTTVVSLAEPSRTPGRASVEQFRDLRERPRVTLDPRGRRRGRTFPRLVTAAEVVVHEVQRHRVRLVLDLLENPLVNRVNRRIPSAS